MFYQHDPDMLPLNVWDGYMARHVDMYTQLAVT